MSQPRYTADSITDDALDALYANAARGWRRGDRWKERVAELEADRDQASASPVLSAAERQFLTFALDQAADEMSFSDGFTDEDRAALETLRRLVHATTSYTVETAPVVAVSQPSKER